MEKKAKRSYKRPEVFKVKLMPQEAVLAGCKQDGSGKPQAPSRCDVGCASEYGS